ncbi:MAG: F0F1 ATP synthase subunit epsilon [Candidatus Eisenbacteria bacterium]|nr:F0F1 ATP synthase subunit epsilon [Candidatus Eisenbacteria bacterium]
METFQLSLQTPRKVVLDQPVVSLTAPGGLGYLGILAHHAPLITNLVPGKLTLRDPAGGEQVFAVSGGFMEVSENRATILADTVERPEEIDVERARAARDRAQNRLKETGGGWDVDRARVALLRAMNRLRVAGSGR